MAQGVINYALTQKAVKSYLAARSCENYFLLTHAKTQLSKYHEDLLLRQFKNSKPDKENYNRSSNV